MKLTLKSNLTLIAAALLAIAPLAVQAEVDPEQVVEGVRANASTLKSSPVNGVQADTAMSGVLVSRTDSGLDFRIADGSVSEIQVDVYSVSSGEVLWSSNRIAGNSVVWQADLEDGASFRFSIKGWDRTDTLVTHQVTTKGVSSITNISFDNVPINTKFLGAGDIDLDGPTNVNGTLTADSFDTHQFLDSSVGNNTVKIEADNNSASDLLEMIMVAGSATGQFIEFQEGATTVGQINADGSAWFQNSTQQIPAFLPIAFGFINSDGSVASSSGNITSTWSGTLNRYQITISGHTYFFNDYTTQVTPSGAADSTTRTGSSSGNLLVNIYNSSGTSIQSSFQFVTFFNPVDLLPERPSNGLDQDEN